MRGIVIDIKWAIIFAAMSLGWMWLEKVTGLHSTHIDQQAALTNLIAIPAIVVYVFALLDKRKNYYGGTMTYLHGLFTGLIITLFVTILSPLTQYITSVYITPEYFPNVIEYAVTKGVMTRAEAENYFNLRSFIFMGLIYTPVMGVITSALVAIFLRRKAR